MDLVMNMKIVVTRNDDSVGEEKKFGLLTHDDVKKILAEYTNDVMDKKFKSFKVTVS